MALLESRLDKGHKMKKTQYQGYLYIAIMTIIVVAISMAAGCEKSDLTGNVVMEEQAGSAAGGQEQAQQDTAQAPAASDAPATSSMYQVKCGQDSECGEITIGEPYCFQNTVITPIKKPTCINAGTIRAYCRTESDDNVEVCESGSEICRQRECLVLADLPCKDTDGGKDYYEAGEVTDAELIVYKDTCTGRTALLEYYCINGKGLVKKEEHLCAAPCKMGACVED